MDPQVNDEDENFNFIDLLAAADDVVNNDRHPKTIEGYRRRIGQMRKFARESNVWDEAIFDEASLPDDFVKEFLALQVQPYDNGSVRTASTIRGHISAIKWWYSNNNAILSDEMEAWL